jgi:hypothetical protein
LGDLIGTGGSNSVGNFITLTGRLVIVTGRGVDSIREILLRGSVDRREAGRSPAEQPRITWRKWEFAV